MSELLKQIERRDVLKSQLEAVNIELDQCPLDHSERVDLVAETVQIRNKLINVQRDIIRLMRLPLRLV